MKVMTIAEYIDENYQSLASYTLGSNSMIAKYGKWIIVDFDFTPSNVRFKRRGIEESMKVINPKGREYAFGFGHDYRKYGKFSPIFEVISLEIREKGIRRTRNVQSSVNYSRNSYNGGDSYRNDCQITTLSTLLNIPYDVAHTELAANGWREDNAGSLWTRNWVGIAEKHGYLIEESGRFSKIKIKAKTIAGLASNYPIGKFAVTVKGHVFALIDGVIYDNGTVSMHPYMRVRNLMEFVDCNN